MRNIIWYEMCQAKFNHTYCTLLLVDKRKWLNAFTIIIAVFSGAGVMGWSVWKDLPLVACIIISCIQILRLIQPHILPTEKQVDKLDGVVSFYFDYVIELEKLWLDYDRDKVDDEEAQNKYYSLKQTEKEINKIISEVVKRKHNKITSKTEKETRNYLTQNFN